MSSVSFSVRPSVVAVRFALLGLCVISVAASAQQQENTQAADVLPAINVTSEVAPTRFTAQKATSSTKSDKPLFETPQSVSVLTRELLDTRQVTTLNEALQTSAGVSAGGLGRRGWDDFTIRGQDASNTMYLDGIRISQANWVAQEIFGAEQIEIFKGPASISFGQTQPGGIVNIISKRPRAEAFNQVGFTFGSYGYRQGTFDFGRPLNSENGKAAFRVTGMASDSDDQTDYVWFKNRYIAPSISLDFGSRTDFTILAAINQRQYLRQQGTPYLASSLVNNGISVPRSFFTSDPSVGAYDAEQKSIGYALTHRFDSGWTLQQNLRYTEMTMTGALANVTGAVVTNGTTVTNGNIARNVLKQDFWEHGIGVDTNIEKKFDLGQTKHSVMLGIDANEDHLYRDTKRCVINPTTATQLNIYRPQYNRAVTGCAYQTAAAGIIDTTISYVAFYARDQIQLSDKWSLNLALRHDRAELKTITPLNNTTRDQKNNATTGSIGAMYQATSNVAPYVSYATSFLPQAGATIAGALINPEKGEQSEIGVKFQSDDKRLNAALAYYDLTRRNVSQADAVNTGYQVEIGEQRTKGYEAEFNADLNNGWNLLGTLSILDGKVTKDVNSSYVGQNLSNVPRRSASILANYRFSGAMQGWGAGAGLRHESRKSALGINYTVPGYTVADANISYQGQGYRIQLNVKNLFDKEYYAGVFNANVVPLGDPRTIMLKTVFDF
ncbi:TonB-dependent siderophore receptor [uncultured Oxalicibacterium sp.]|uniref:TonB-dependent siderophore receptor n=1 Tax=uncultured Oxalicibacterium sp. TaxID=1168540 RepID=UPI0025E28422|nr:TonB-dependent siderophore receptor [uncultured Oxalicibacterium sp.]